MATNSSILAWRIPWTEEPSGLLSMGSHRVGHDWSDLACMHAFEKEMATHSSILAWRIPGTEEPGGLLSMELHRVGHDWSDLAAAAAAVAWDATFIICSISISCELYFKAFSSVLLVCLFIHQCVLCFIFGGFLCQVELDFPPGLSFFILVFLILIACLFFSTWTIVSICLAPGKKVIFIMITFCCSVTQLCLTLCSPMDCSMPGFPVLHHLPELAQTDHWVGDTIQPSHPLSALSPPAFSLFQHQGLFQWVSSLHQVAKILELQLQHQSFQWIFMTDSF